MNRVTFGTKSPLTFLLDLDKEHTDQGATNNHLKTQEEPLTKPLPLTKPKTDLIGAPFKKKNSF